MFKNKFLKFGIIFLSGIVLGAFLFYAGFRFDLYNLSSQETFSPAATSSPLLSADMGLFWDSLTLLKERHFQINKVSDEDLLYGAIKGVVGSLNDPYSAFFNPSDAKKFSQDIEGSFGGIGAEIGIRNKELIIVAPLKGNPAEAAGLKAGDKILKVNETLTNDLTVEEAVKLIRGEIGTEVTLLILRDTWTEAKEFKITRALVVIPTLDWEMKEGNILHLRLYNFNANAPELFYEAALSSLLKGAEGIVLDLRNNPGGFLEVANNIAGWFLRRGEVIVREKFRSGEDNLFRAAGTSALAEVPTVILINGGSASASEIVAGALRDNRGIKLIGEKTFGKGTVQEVESLKDGSSLKISVAEWLTPGGHKIEGVGLEPDYAVKLTDSDIEKKFDPQLDKAFEVLREEIKKSGGRIFVIGS